MINDLLSVFPGLFDVLVFLAVGGAIWYTLERYDKHTHQQNDKETK